MTYVEHEAEKQSAAVAEAEREIVKCKQQLNKIARRCVGCSATWIEAALDALKDVSHGPNYATIEAELAADMPYQVADARREAAHGF